MRRSSTNNNPQKQLSFGDKVALWFLKIVCFRELGAIQKAAYNARHPHHASRHFLTERRSLEEAVRQPSNSQIIHEG